MPNVTKKQLAKRWQPHRLRGCWFYLDENKQKCSFHSKKVGEGYVLNIPVTAILRALEARGFLDQWDRKQQVLRKAERPTHGKK